LPHSPKHVERHLAIARLRVGGRQSDVARELGVSQIRDRPRSRAPRVTDRNDDQYLRTYALRHRYASATKLQTIRNRLHRFGLNWAQDHVTWTMQQWSTVLFTDECRVTLHRNDVLLLWTPLCQMYYILSTERKINESFLTLKTTARKIMNKDN
uniref:Transposase Tc1-like domain-containing protein n=1 Tax=Stegastes partitus TaxID=144197 RepID=A0A3B5AIF8_9TELE